MTKNDPGHQWWSWKLRPWGREERRIMSGGARAVRKRETRREIQRELNHPES